MPPKPTNPTPKLNTGKLSHYTNLAGLMGMVDSGEIWASNVSFLNDRRELLHGLDASLDAIRAFTKSNTNRNWHAALKHSAEALTQGVIPNTYAACFCRNADVLSQWRGYGGAEQGVSITFNKAKLKSLLKKDKATLYPVIYGNVTTVKKVSKALKGMLENLDSIEQLVGDWTDKERNDEAYSAICRLLPQFKHWGFKDEYEQRFVVQHDTIRENVCFRTKRNVLVPFLKLGPGKGGILPIVSVKIGPGPDQDLTERSVRLYLQKNGYEATKVTLSTVPFRT